MSATEKLLARNDEFVAGAFEPGLTAVPKLRTIVITCADPRVDPAHFLGIEPGEAAVIRNAGGRVTPAAMQSIAMLAAVAEANGVPPDFELVVVHHTNCGVAGLAEEEDLLADYFGVEPAELADKHVADPHAAVAADIDTLRANDGLPPSLTASGLVFDVETGRAETVVEPAPLRG